MQVLLECIFSPLHLLPSRLHLSISILHSLCLTLMSTRLSDKPMSCLPQEPVKIFNATTTMPAVSWICSRASRSAFVPKCVFELTPQFVGPIRSPMSVNVNFKWPHVAPLKISPSSTLVLVVTTHFHFQNLQSRRFRLVSFHLPSCSFSCTLCSTHTHRETCKKEQAPKMNTQRALFDFLFEFNDAHCPIAIPCHVQQTHYS